MFLTLEGPDGSGKTTQRKLLHQWLTSLKLPVIATREPGGTPLCEDIRALILKNKDMDPRTLASLMIAARAEHVSKVIQPALNEGHIVLCDRYSDSTRVYQSISNHRCPIEPIMNYSNHVTAGLKPDLTLVFPKTHKDYVPQDHFDEMNQQEISEIYLKIARKDPERCKLVPHDLPIEVTALVIQEIVKKQLYARGLVS